MHKGLCDRPGLESNVHYSARPTRRKSASDGGADLLTLAMVLHQMDAAGSVRAVHSTGDVLSVSAPPGESPWSQLTSSLLLLGGAVVPVIHLLGWLLEYRGERRVHLDVQLRPAITKEAQRGLLLWIHNRGGVTINTVWAILENGRGRVLIPLERRPPLARCRVETVALSWRSLVPHGIEEHAPMRARVVIDLGREFASKWSVIRERPMDMQAGAGAC